MTQVTAASFSPRARMRMLLLGTTLAVMAAISHTAWAQPAPPPPGGPGHHMHGGGMGGMMFGGSPEHVSRMIDHMLDGLNASDAQRAQIKQIAVAAATDLKAMAPAGRDLRQRSMQIFTAPTVDANAAEQVRQQMLQQHDQMSRRMTQAMVDMATVLTPDQRAQIAARMRDRQARMEERMNRMDRRPPQ